MRSRTAGLPAIRQPSWFSITFVDDDALQAIAAENNLAETAFLVAEGEDLRVRWFTPTVEVPLCGHATLAGAAVVMERLAPGRTRVVCADRNVGGSAPLRRARRSAAAVASANERRRGW
jgi:PhzF family phenazine biosynthesis protein